MKKVPKYSHTKRDINLAVGSKVLYNLAIHLVEKFTVKTDFQCNYSLFASSVLASKTIF